MSDILNSSLCGQHTRIHSRVSLPCESVCELIGEMALLSLTALALFSCPLFSKALPDGLLNDKSM